MITLTIIYFSLSFIWMVYAYFTAPVVEDEESQSEYIKYEISADEMEQIIADGKKTGKEQIIKNFNGYVLKNIKK